MTWPGSGRWHKHSVLFFCALKWEEDTFIFTLQILSLLFTFQNLKMSLAVPRIQETLANPQSFSSSSSSSCPCGRWASIELRRILTRYLSGASSWGWCMLYKCYNHTVQHFQIIALIVITRISNISKEKKRLENMHNTDISLSRKGEHLTDALLQVQIWR